MHRLHKINFRVNRGVSRLFSLCLNARAGRLPALQLKNNSVHSLKSGNVIAKVAEIHDIAVSKLIAGREKDFVFLKELFLREYISIEIFLARAELIKEMPQSEILIPRLENLVKVLPKAEGLNVKNFIAGLKLK